jgi:hypothetical protein
MPITSSTSNPRERNESCVRCTRSSEQKGLLCLSRRLATTIFMGIVCLRQLICLPSHTFRKDGQGIRDDHHRRESEALSNRHEQFDASILKIPFAAKHSAAIHRLFCRRRNTFASIAVAGERAVFLGIPY